MIFCRRWRRPARSAAAPAGSRSICSPKTPTATLLGAAPCYVKTHSRGEYVFDHGWAEAYERAGGDYYPKLQVAVPFTPVTGPRLLAPARPDCRRGARRRSPTRWSRSAARQRAVLGARHLPDRGGMASCSASAASCSAPTSSSTGRTPATRRSTISSAALVLAQAQDHPARAQGRAGARHRACTG